MYGGSAVESDELNVEIYLFTISLFLTSSTLLQISGPCLWSTLTEANCLNAWTSLDNSVRASRRAPSISFAELNLKTSQRGLRVQFGAGETLSFLR